MRFGILLLVVVLCRAADLYSTWALTPTLRLELNPIIRWMGWRWTILLNIALCPLAAWWGGFWYGFLCSFSLVATVWNVRQIRRCL